MIQPSPQANGREQGIQLSRTADLPAQLLRQNFEDLNDPRLECIAREVSNGLNQGYLFQIGYPDSELAYGPYLQKLRFGILSWINGKNELVFTTPNNHDSSITIEVPYNLTVSQAVEAAVCDFAFRITDWLHGDEIRHVATIISSAFLGMSPEEAGFILKPIDRRHAMNSLITGKADFDSFLSKLNLSREELADSCIEALRDYITFGGLPQVLEKLDLTPEDLRAAAGRAHFSIKTYPRLDAALTSLEIAPRS